MSFQKLIAISGLCATTACGGTSLSTEDKFIDRISSAQAQAERVFDLPGTKFSAVPVNGSASFEGNASLFIDPVFETDNDDILVAGDANLTANFGAGTIQGDVTNMQAAVNFAGVGAAETFDIVPVGGTIVIGEDYSLIGPDPDDNLQNRPNQWFSFFDGDLTIEGDQFIFGGGLLGEFRGTRANPQDGQSAVKAISASSILSVGYVNDGTEKIPVFLDIVAEN